MVDALNARAIGVEASKKERDTWHIFPLIEHTLAWIWHRFYVIQKWMLFLSRILCFHCDRVVPRQGIPPCSLGSPPFSPYSPGHKLCNGTKRVKRPITVLEIWSLEPKDSLWLPAIDHNFPWWIATETWCGMYLEANQPPLAPHRPSFLAW